MSTHITWISIIVVLISGSVGWAQLAPRSAFLAPMQEDALTLPPALELKQKQWLKDQLAPQPGDEQIIAIVGDEEVPHRLVRSQADEECQSGLTCVEDIGADIDVYETPPPAPAYFTVGHSPPSIGAAIVAALSAEVQPTRKGAWQWQRCTNATGTTGCVSLTSRSPKYQYMPVAGDVGQYLRAAVGCTHAACGAAQQAVVVSERVHPGTLLALGHADYCKQHGPCVAGYGDCDTNSECQSGLTCVGDVGARYGFGADIDVCEAALTPPEQSRSLNNHSLRVGQGFTYNFSAVWTGETSFTVVSSNPRVFPLTKLSRFGHYRGEARAVGSATVTVMATNAAGSDDDSFRMTVQRAPMTVGYADYCRDQGPCSVGQGDCDRNRECQSGLRCVNDVGARYGFYYLRATQDAS